ncbi:hypothetical protein SAMN05518861_11694 [Mesorhizobium sp. YR577]|nr:hypothetical protein SAMN05518861_11694 [Mesorhizobium sp. YR577]
MGSKLSVNPPISFSQDRKFSPELGVLIVKLICEQLLQTLILGFKLGQILVHIVPCLRPG